MDVLVGYALRVANALHIGYPCANNGPCHPDGAMIGYTMADGTVITDFLVEGFRGDSEDCEGVALRLSQRIASKELNRFATPHGAPIMMGGEIHTVLVESPTGVIVRGIMSPDLLGHLVYRFDVLGGHRPALTEAKLVSWDGARN